MTMKRNVPKMSDHQVGLLVFSRVSFFGQNRTVEVRLLMIAFVSAFFSFNIRLWIFADGRQSSFAFARSRIPAGVYVRHTKDRMVCDGVSHGKTAVIHRACAVDCTRGLPVTADSRIVDHVERIDRGVLRRHRFSNTVRSGEPRPWNDRRALYQCAPGRRLAESSPLSHHLPLSDLYRRWQILSRSFGEQTVK